MSSEEASSVLGFHGFKILRGRGSREAAGDGEFEVANQGVEEFRGRGLADNSVIPFLSELDERFRDHAVEGD